MTGTDFERTQRSLPLSAQIGAQLRARIESGELAVGTKIPGEHELVEAFGASRSTVREALRGLVHAGLLEARPGDGTYVRAASELEAAVRRRTASCDVGDVFEVREALEIHAARLAAERATDADVRRLTDLLAARDAAPASAERVEADLAFHLEMVAVAGNALLAEMHANLDLDAVYEPGDLTDDERHEWLIGGWEGPDGPDPHHALLDAIARRSPDEAGAAAAAVIGHARALFFRLRRT